MITVDLNLGPSASQGDRDGFAQASVDKENGAVGHGGSPLPAVKREQQALIPNRFLEFGNRETAILGQFGNGVPRLVTRSHVLANMCMISPSLTIYVFPSRR